MTQTPTNSKKASRPVIKSWLKRNFPSILMFAAVIAITVILFIYQEDVKRFQEIGYAGAFIISLIGNATVLLPMPGVLLIIPIGAALNPWLVGLIAGTGATIGEMTSYAAGFSGRGIFENNKTYQQASGWLKKWGIGIVFLFAVLPLPIDIMGLAAGNLRFPWWKYILGILPGKLIKYVALVYAGAWGYKIYSDGGPVLDAIQNVGMAMAGTIVVFIVALLLENWSWKKGKNRSS
jgi:membrane protein YqaA with SNARE-associated domain